MEKNKRGQKSDSLTHRRTKWKTEKWERSSALVCLKMGTWELGGKSPGLTRVIPRIPADSQGKDTVVKSSVVFGSNPVVRLWWYDVQERQCVKQESNDRKSEHLLISITSQYLFPCLQTPTHYTSSLLNECCAVITQPVTCQAFELTDLFTDYWDITEQPLGYYSKTLINVL